MASNQFGAAHIVLSAQSDKLTRAFGDASKSIDGLGGNVKGIMRDLVGTVAPLAAVGYAFKTAFAEAKRIDDISDATGLAAGQIVQLEQAAIKAGVGSESMTNALMRMQVMVGKAMNGDDGAIKSFQKLGISVADLAGKTDTERFSILANAIGQIDERSKAAALSSEIFGKSSAKMLDAMGSMSKAVATDEFTERVNRSYSALNRWGDSISLVASQMKTGFAVMIGTALDYYGDKLGIAQVKQESFAKSADTSADELDRAFLKIRSSLRRLSDDSLNKMHAQEMAFLDERNDKNAKANRDFIALSERTYDTLENLRIESHGREAQEQKRFDDEILSIKESARLAGQTDSLREFQTIESATEQHLIRLNEIRRTDAKEAGKISSDAFAYVMEPMQKAKEENDKAEKKRAEEYDYKAGKTKAQVKKEAEAKLEADRAAAQAQRDKIQALDAYGQALGNITQITAEGANKSREQFYVHKALMLAQSIVNTWTAYTAAQTIPPPAGQILAGTILAGGFYAASQIAAQQPGRANGGPVSGGKTYEVGENGPEIMTMNGRNYVIPGRDGYVNNGSPGGGSSRITVNVINNGAPATASVQQSGPPEAPRIDVILNAVAGDIRSGQGSVARAVEGTYGLNRRAGAR